MKAQAENTKAGDTPGDGDGENRERISPLIDAHTRRFLRRSRRFGTSISFPDYNQVIFRVRAAILKSHVIKLPNLIG